MGIAFDIDFWSKETYLPTKRHKKLRSRAVKHSISVEIREVVEAEFPVAFIVHDYQSVFDAAEYDSEITEFKMWSKEIRAYKGNLYSAARISYGAAISARFQPLSFIKEQLDERMPYSWGSGEDFTEQSISVSTDYDERCSTIAKTAENFLVFDGKVWTACGEPMYNIMTFGLGHNHGGTGFFISYSYNSNISKRNYFNALERDKAIAYGKQVARNRGDTESIDRMGEYDIIEVLMPEMVKRNPAAEHGDGSPLLNGLEDLISATDNATEAGLLCLAAAMKSV